MSLKSAVLKRLPRLGDPLPICGKLVVGKFRMFPLWTGAGPLPYPRWFILACRLEAWVIGRIIWIVMRKERLALRRELLGRVFDLYERSARDVPGDTLEMDGRPPEGREVRSFSR